MAIKEELVYINGDYYPRSEARISVFDAGLMTGDTMTESTRTFRHRPFRLRDHLVRLSRSMKVARYPAAPEIDDLERITLEVVGRNLPRYGPEDDFWIVHNVTRGSFQSSNDPSRNRSAATVIVFTMPLDLTYWARFYEEGCHAVTPFSRAIPSEALDPKMKNRSRLGYTLCDLEVKLVDPDAQCILLDTLGNLAENKGGNFFVVSGDTVLTPTTRNVLAGISRDTILDLCRELQIRAVERDLQPYDVYTADEAFFTSTPYCIMPATRFNGLPVGDGRVGPVTRRLLAAWGSRVGVDIAAQGLAQLRAAAGAPA
jgi:branched-chain amino acid aminotransferase